MGKEIEIFMSKYYTNCSNIQMKMEYCFETHQPRTNKYIARFTHFTYEIYDNQNVFVVLKMNYWNS